ncbi:hypothetical protein [Rossellomorea marisflavi]|uniref:hypothetical protein n=1 Tax=Rossellomorea marisflavi TaxID=189381 RepID=UPI00165313A7|nr:hypothetical protein [Rossellomorea marisflavi]UKS66018.1 hypothetical protein K6T23_03860 [Rossellomorea marisflavi]
MTERTFFSVFFEESNNRDDTPDDHQAEGDGIPDGRTGIGYSFRGNEHKEEGYYTDDEGEPADEAIRFW